MKKQITACGKLTYTDYDAEYIIPTKTGTTNISQILNKIYNSNKKIINIKVMSGSKTLFNEEGILRKKPDKYGVECYHVNGDCLDLALFDYVGECIDIEIVANAESLEQQGDNTYDTRTYEAKQVAK
jgi:hypothetical protein